jgi:hypothetical protein
LSPRPAFFSLFFFWGGGADPVFENGKLHLTAEINNFSAEFFAVPRCFRQSNLTMEEIRLEISSEKIHI